MTIYEELLAAAKTVEGFKDQEANQSDEDFLKLLAKTINKVSDTTWNGLSMEAGDWYNKAAAAINAMQPIPPCPGFKGQVAVPAPPTKKPEAAKPTAVRTASPPKRPTAVKSTAKQEPAKKEKPKPGVVDEIRRQFILHSDWTNHQIHDYVKANGWPDLKFDTVAVNAGDIRRVITLAKEMGYWNDAKTTEEKADVGSATPETTPAA